MPVKIEISGQNGKITTRFNKIVSVELPWEDCLEFSDNLREMALVMKKGGIKNYPSNEAKEKVQK